MTKVAMRETLLNVRDFVTDSMMQKSLDLAASLVVSRLSGERVAWLMSMLRDMAYDCDGRGQSGQAAALRDVAWAIYSG